jgi:hypothetical protein
LITCAIELKVSVEGSPAAASAILLVSVPRTAPNAAVVTKPFSAARRLMQALCSSSSGRLLERFEPMSSRSRTTIGAYL